MNEFPVRKDFVRVVVAALVITSGLFVAGGSDEVADFVEISSAFLAEASSSLRTALTQDQVRRDGSVGPENLESPTATASLTSVAAEKADRNETREAALNSLDVKGHGSQQEPSAAGALSGRSLAPFMVVDRAESGVEQRQATAALDRHVQPTQEPPAREPPAIASPAVEQTSLAQLDPTKSEVEPQRQRELAAEVERLKQESAEMRKAKAAAEAALAAETRARREERELLTVVQQELFRASDETEQLKKQSTAAAEKAAARERERASALRRELQASQREVQRLRAALASQAQTASRPSRARAATRTPAEPPVSSPPAEPQPTISEPR